MGKIRFRRTPEQTSHTYSCPHPQHALQLDWPGVGVRLCLAEVAQLHDQLAAWLAVNRPAAKPEPEPAILSLLRKAQETN